MSTHTAGYGFSARESPRGTIQLKWDPKNLEIKTKSVEMALEPLVKQVTTLVNSDKDSGKRKGLSKHAHVLAAAVNMACQRFIERGQEISAENPAISPEMDAALLDVQQNGDIMRVASLEFANDPCSSDKRGAMVKAARGLLSAVTRLLIVADMVDVHMLLNALKVVQDNLAKVRKANTQQELMSSFKTFGENVVELQHLTQRRQIDLKDRRHRDDMAAARAILKKNSMMLLTSSKTHVRHPDVNAALANRDYATNQVSDAVNIIETVTQAKGPSQPRPGFDGPGELAAALDDFDQRIQMNRKDFNEKTTRPSLEERLENIISGAALMADSSCTRDDRREKIVQECNNVRQALQDLLSEYMRTPRGNERSDELDEAIDHTLRKTHNLKRQLRRAVVDHVSDSFLESDVPLKMLVEAARSGNERRVEECARIFQDHAYKLVEVANLACSMSNNEDGIKCVRYAADQLDNLCPQVINAARTLAARPRSKVAEENLDVFKSAWEMQVSVLTEAVDDITTIDDFLAVSEGHILEDCNKCVQSLQDRDLNSMFSAAGAVDGRAKRICHVVGSEMDNYESGDYTQEVLNAVSNLRNTIIPNFRNEVDRSTKDNNGNMDDDENEFIDSCRLVYDGIRDIRRAVLVNRPYDDWDEDTDFEDEDWDKKSMSSFHSDHEKMENKSDRALMRALPEEEKIKIAEQVKLFNLEKQKLDTEVMKWDDTGNDIIVLAKEMCMIMMEMTDFTRGRGPMKTTSDVIAGAKQISERGQRLKQLASIIAENCAGNQTKRDLEAYLQQIILYCHQLTICSKVKAEVQNISGELVVSGLESATSLIQSGKNLMEAVVHTVKHCYIASTKYSNNNLPSVVVWKMKAPSKKPLIRREGADEQGSAVRRGSGKQKVSPLQALTEFKGTHQF